MFPLKSSTRSVLCPTVENWFLWMVMSNYINHWKVSPSLQTYLTWLVVLLSPTKVLIGTDSITNLHKLEQVSSDEGIGTLAENLLEALREHSDVNLKIEAARRETRAEKKRMAMAMRQKALGTLGMTVLFSFTVFSLFSPFSMFLVSKCCSSQKSLSLTQLNVILLIFTKCVLNLFSDQWERSGGDEDLTVEANGGVDRGAGPDLLYL